MAIHITTIDGFEVEIDTDTDGNGRTGCWIQKGRNSGSLELLMGEGVLLGHNDDLRVPQSTIDAIEQWALENGY